MTLLFEVQSTIKGKAQGLNVHNEIPALNLTRKG